MNKDTGSTVLITGGYEVTPQITVVNGRYGEKVLQVEQNGNKVELSMLTLESILSWAKE